ncbi:MAG: DUF2071 domain-containing protein [Acidobacteriota bacterium]|nr:DUF2071 domain-containing protein [Acidobacteriota bacterium]
MGDFNHAILDETAHRPWPMPAAPWVMTQTWHDLLFAHWRVDAEVLRAKIPRAFDLDLFDGDAWLGIVPFRMTNVTARGVPALPWVSAFPEINVRTYVTAGGKSGVYFFSLDAANTLAVTTARAVLNLPYYVAEMAVSADGEDVRYDSRRPSDPGARFRATYAPIAPARPPEPGTLEHFLTERYCLYNIDHVQKPYRLEIHHPAWPLQAAKATIAHNEMAAVNGITLPNDPPLLHFARRQDVVAWRPTRL